MPILESKIPIILLPLLLMGSAGDASEIIALRSFESWESTQSESATTLSVVEFSCQQESRRVFISLPDGEDWVLESLVRPGTGYARWVLTHQRSGWSIRIEDRYEGSIEARSPTLYGDVLFWQKIAESEPVERERTLSVGADEIAKDTSPAPLLSRADLAESFPPPRMRELLGGRMPAPVVEDLGRLFDLMRAPEGASGTFSPFLPLAETIGSTEEGDHEADERDRVQWTRVDTQAFGGSTADRSVEIDLLERFGRSADALAGLHAPPDGGCKEPSRRSGHR